MRRDAKHLKTLLYRYNLLLLDFVHLVTDINAKVKVKIALEQATKTQRGSRGIALLFL
jgi:ABC-type uncharacterized transport system ATPase subunit